MSGAERTAAGSYCSYGDEIEKSSFRRDAETSTRDACVTLRDCGLGVGPITPRYGRGGGVCRGREEGQGLDVGSGGRLQAGVVVKRAPHAVSTGAKTGSLQSPA